jgi:hypothetical protein
MSSQIIFAAIFESSQTKGGMSCRDAFQSPNGRETDEANFMQPCLLRAFLDYSLPVLMPLAEIINHGVRLHLNRSHQPGYVWANI